MFENVENRVIATARRSLEAAAQLFRDNGIEPVILGDSITGEAKEVAKVMAALAREIRTHGSPFKPPVALLSGGECTVTVRRTGGRGGRCGEFLLALGIELAGVADVHAIAADTDGIDGSERQCRRPARAGFARARARAGAGPEKVPRGQRQLRDFFRARRPGGHRAHAHQRQRLPGDIDRLTAQALVPSRRRAQSARFATPPATPPGRRCRNAMTTMP